MKASDAVLIAKVVATGSHDAFAKLVEAHQAPVRRFLLRMTQGDAMRTDDLAQETLTIRERCISNPTLNFIPCIFPLIATLS